MGDCAVEDEVKLGEGKKKGRRGEEERKEEKKQHGGRHMNLEQARVIKPIKRLDIG